MSDLPIRTGHPDEGFTPIICGCCDGTELATLRPTGNRPNLTAIAFRAGDHAQFKASMLTGLASAAYPALQGLGTRENDDFSIALIDAWAAACDVLTFYQERLANEAYIGTATERLSIGELARLIGYRLHPGAAAETDLLILMDDPPGAPPDSNDLLVPKGTRVQSQPGPDEEPQIFECIEDLTTRVAWNALRPQQTQPVSTDNGDTFTWLQGTPALQLGDAILIVGAQRGGFGVQTADPESELWDFRRVTEVQPDAANDRTRVTWDKPLGSVSPPGLAAQSSHRFYHLKDRASLFGYNAPHPKVLGTVQHELFGFAGDPISNPPSPFFGTDDDPGDWVFEHPGNDEIWLDAIYKSFVQDSWVVLTKNNGLTELYRITEVHDDGVSRYSVSGKASRLVFDTTENLANFDHSAYRRTSVYGGSLQIPFAEHPITDFVSGSQIALAGRADDLPNGRKLIFTGKRARLSAIAHGLVVNIAGAPNKTLEQGEEVTLQATPVAVPATSNYLFEVMTDEGINGFITAAIDALRVVPAPENAQIMATVVILDHTQTTGPATTTLHLSEQLPYPFDRASLTIHANVVRAAHGEGVTDILGSGDPSQPFQKFLLKQSPVTHRAAPTETGIESTLTLRVDGVEWQEVPDLYQRGTTSRVYKTALTDAGETIIEFGDGHSGARPNAGRDNIVADYSRSIGSVGNLKPGQLTLPLDRPLGLKDTNNPLPATGGADAEAQNDARRNAPIYTLTLGRVVSLNDYRDFALGFPGIAKAEARWVWQGESRRIVVTVAGNNGAQISVGSTTHTNLLEAFRALGDPLVQVDLLSYAPATFRLGLRLAVLPEYDPDVVLPATEATLREAFSFQTRDFAQTLALSEVAAVAHQVAGLRAIDVDLLARNQAPQTASTAHVRLISQPGRRGLNDALLPAEILTLSSGPLHKLDLMP